VEARHFAEELQGASQFRQMYLMCHQLKYQ